MLFAMDNDSQESICGIPDSPGNASQIRLTATAYHEAGHATMALALGRAIQKVTVSPANLQTGGRRLGLCEMKKGRTKSPKDWLENEVLILLAGMVAEARFTGEYCHLGASQDLLAVRSLLRKRVDGESQIERLQRRMLDKTEHLLSDPGHAMAIELIAQELILTTKISGRAALHLFNQAVHRNS